MEDKKLPQSETDEQNINGAVPDDDEYFSLEDVSDEVSDDDLDLSELIRKYMPDEEDPLAPSYDAPSEEISDNAEPEYYGGEDGANSEDYPESYDDVPTDGGADYGAPDEADADTIDSAVYADYADEAGADGDDGETAEYEDSTDLDYTGYDDDSDDADDADGELVYDEPAADEEYAYDGGETDADDEQCGEYGDGEPYYDENAPELDEVADVALDTDGEEDSMSDTSSQDYVNYEDGDGDIELDGDLDYTDINLMLAFGLDDELERTMGPEVAQKLTEELDEEQRVRDEKVRKTVDNEYMNRTQTAGIAADYKKKFKGLKLKIFLSVVLAAVLFFYENLRIFGFEFDGALNPAVYPVVYIMVSLQILLFCAACAYREILGGIGELFTGKISPRSVTAVMTAAAVVYSAILSHTVVPPEMPILFNFAVAVSIIFTLIFEFLNTKREIFAFNVVASKRPKHIVAKLPCEAEDGGDILKFETASFIDGYFTRTKEPTGASKSYATASLVIAIISGVLCALYTKFFSTGSTVAQIAESAAAAFFIACPVSMFITMSYPFFRASRDAYDNDGAIIGECSLEEYSEASVVTFDDVGVFPSYGVKVQNVKIYNNHRIDRVLFYAASVFSTARGPLTDVFDVATVEIGHSDDVKIKAAGSGYLAASVDGKNITFGTASELVERGFVIPESITDEDEENGDDISVMYMFREEKLMSKMLIKYTMDTDFEFIMDALCDEGISISIKTNDPNIDDSMIAVHVGRGKYSYTVSRYEGADDGSTVRDNADSGIVSRSTAKTLLQILSDCTKVLAARRVGITIGVISSIISFVLMILVLLAGRTEALNSGVLFIYQLFWLIPSLLTARMYVR